MEKGRKRVRKPVITDAILGAIVHIRLILHTMLYRHLIIFAFYVQVRILILMLFSPSFSLSLSLSFPSFFLLRQFSVQFVLIVPNFIEKIIIYNDFCQ